MTDHSAAIDKEEAEEAEARLLAAQIHARSRANLAAVVATMDEFD